MAAGSVVDVSPPFGGFCLDPDTRNRRTYYFFAAGSGITPLYSMLSSVLVAEPHSVVHLLYGNTDAGTIIFRDDLAGLAEDYEGRLRFRHILSSHSGRSSLRHWRRGRIDASRVAEFIVEHPPYAQDTRHYVCGPGDMNGVVRATLLGMDVPAERIYTEHYGPVAPSDDSVAGMASTMTVRLGGNTSAIPVGSGQTILNAVRVSGGSPPHSCEAGVCGACRARLRDGSVHMRARMALTDPEIDRGVILTCQALPTTAQVAVEYD